MRIRNGDEVASVPVEDSIGRGHGNATRTITAIGTVGAPVDVDLIGGNGLAPVILHPLCGVAASPMT